jgi:uncharacterized protein
MSLSIKILDCNAGCPSCYENKIRENYCGKYDKKKIIETLKREMNKYKQVTIHGGEPLMMGFLDLKEMLKVIYKKFKSTGIQTNLLLLKKRHISYFKNYNTHVGVSIDGDTIEMNQGRGYDPQKVIDNIKWLRDSGIKMSIIVVLRKYNAGPDNIDKLIKFLKRLKTEFGIADIRCNPGIVYDESLRIDEELLPYDLGFTYMKLFDFIMNESDMSLQPVRDFIDGMMGYNEMTCSFGECDPYNTTAEVTIMHDGSMGNCLKSGTALDGIAAIRTNEYSNVRSKILKQVDCKDCKYWFMCHGGCPGAAIDNDWRNKTRFCESYKMVYSHIHKKLKNLFPNIYLMPDFYPEKGISIDLLKGSTWKKSHRISNGELYTYKKSSAGREYDKEIRKRVVNGHGDHHADSHGDRPHGDSNDPEWREANKWK